MELLPLSSLRERADHIAQREQAFVDADSLLLAIALGLRLLQPFRPSQIDQLEFGGECEVSESFMLVRFMRFSNKNF